LKKNSNHGLNIFMGEKKMITLTEKENKLAQYLIDHTDGTDCQVIAKDSHYLKNLNWNFETIRSVYGSLIDKGLLHYVDENENAEIYKWSAVVKSECADESEHINTVAELLNKLNKEGK
jgi:hypothetical protein